MLAPPSASTINIRRHSTHHYQAGGGGDGGSNDSSMKRKTSINPVPVEPPPVPRRTFLGKIMTPRSSSESSSPSSIKTTFNYVCKQTMDEVKRRNGCTKPAQNVQQQTRRIVENRYPIDQYSDDDRLSIESSVFEDPKSSDPIIFAASSNRSSSDSNKSQMTIDTGYMSASNDTDRIFFGASEDFRSRFSSVDTQSSIDSCTSSDMPTQQAFNLQNHARCIISPLAAKRDEYEERFNNLSNKNFARMNSSNNVLAIQNAVNSTNNGNLKNNNNAASNDTTRRMPPIPTRNQPPISKINSTNNNNKINNKKVNQSPRGNPPPPLPPPIIAQNSLDSGRILYNGTMLGAFQSGLAKITSAAATTSEAVMGRRSVKQNNALNQSKPTTSSHTKLNQRQDSSISSDSFSLTSSPGYNTKNMDVPLLQHASKINKTSCLNGQESTDGINLTPKYPFHGRTTMRQDSTLSSDSFSQISSPGYNTKLLEQPLLAHAVKMHASK